MVRFNDKKQATELSPDDILIMTDVSDSDIDKKVTMEQMAEYVAEIVPSNLPSQTGHSGQFLTTDGQNPSWGDVSSLPAQTGQAGKYLYSDGTDATWRSAYAPPLLSFNWYDHKLNDVRFLRADTFSWQSGEVYTSSYNKILSEWNDVNAKVTINADKQGTIAVSDKGIASGFSTSNYISKTVNIGTTKETMFPMVFDFTTGSDVTTQQQVVGTNYCVNIGINTDSKLTLHLSSNGTANDIADGTVVGTTVLTPSTNYKLILDYDGTNYTLELTNLSDESATTTTEITIASTTLANGGSQAVRFGLNTGSTYPFLGTFNIPNCSIGTVWNGTFAHTSSNGFIILDADQEQYALQQYTNTGVAWYYVLDTANTRFKLPRTKYGFVGLRDTVGGYVTESLPNITGSISTVHCGPSSSTASGAFSLSTVSNSPSSGENNRYKKVSFSANKSSSTYKDNAPVQQRASQMYLYFYVGDYTQDAIEQTAGLNAEQLNSKVDFDCNNISSTGAKRFDGQWVFPTAKFFSFTAIGEYTLDLSTWLPNDGYDYEVWVCGSVARSDSSGTNTVCLLYDKAYNPSATNPTYYRTMRFDADGTNFQQGYAEGCAIVDTNRTLHLSISAYSPQKCDILLSKYRRLGTNR